MEGYPLSAGRAGSPVWTSIPLIRFSSPTPPSPARIASSKPLRGLPSEGSGSRNGTFVNGIPVRSHELQNGDRVESGARRSSILTLDDDPITGETPSSRLSLVTRMVVPVLLGGENHPASLAGNDLQVLMRVATAIHSMKALYSAKEAGARETLYDKRHIVELIFESVPAERGAIVLRKRSSDLPTRSGAGAAPRAAWCCRSTPRPFTRSLPKASPSSATTWMTRDPLHRRRAAFGDRPGAGDDLPRFHPPRRPVSTKSASSSSPPSRR